MDIIETPNTSYYKWNTHHIGATECVKLSPLYQYKLTQVLLRYPMGNCVWSLISVCLCWSCFVVVGIGSSCVLAKFFCMWLFLGSSFLHIQKSKDMYSSGIILLTWWLFNRSISVLPMTKWYRHNIFVYMYIKTEGELRLQSNLR